MIASMNQNVDGKPILMVAESETVNARVLWQKENRKFTDIVWAVLFGLCYLSFLVCGFFLVAKSKPRWVDADADYLIVSEHYRDDVEKCCAERPEQNNDYAYYGDLCSSLESGGRRLGTAGDSKYDYDDGIFSAFLRAPEIIIGILTLTVSLAILWAVLLRFFAKPIVLATELIKIGVFIFMGINSYDTSSRILCFIIAIGILGYNVWARDKLFFAADMITQSVKALKANPWIFPGLLFVKLFYALNSSLFVLFFAEGINLVEVQFENDTCVFRNPDYSYNMFNFIGFAYLWSTLLTAKIRLAVVANIVGSWYFHPENKPPVTRSVINSMTTSIGTLSLASFISVIAEKLNMMLMEPWYKTWCGPACFVATPLHIIMCVFGAFIQSFVLMLTKFAVILHVFTGLPFVGSGKKVIKILKRHFKGGFVTEVTSKGVLTLGAYVFSIGVTFAAWAWFDARFRTETLVGGKDALWFILYILVGLFNLYHPVFGMYIIILANNFLLSWEKSMWDDDRESSNKEEKSYQHYWVSPLAAIFVGCLAMSFFTFIAEIFLDTIDVSFLCYAINKDNNVDLSNDDFEVLVKAVPGYIEAVDVIPVSGKEGDITVDTKKYGDDIQTAVPAKPVELSNLEPAPVPYDVP